VNEINIEAQNQLNKKETESEITLDPRERKCTGIRERKGQTSKREREFWTEREGEQGSSGPVRE